MAAGGAQDALGQQRPDSAVHDAEAQAGQDLLRELEAIECDRQELDQQIDGLLRQQALARLLTDQLPVFTGKRARWEAALAARAEVMSRFSELDLETRRQVVRALCEVKVHPARPGIRHTKANAAERIEITPLDVTTGEPLPQDVRAAV